MAENNVPIEELVIYTEQDSLTDEICVQELKLLKKLRLTHMTEGMLMRFAKDSHLEMVTALSSRNDTVNGIKKILEYGRNLSFVWIETKEITIDTDQYNSILNLARDRVRVKIIIIKNCGHIINRARNRVRARHNILKTIVHVPDGILKANITWLKIDLTSAESRPVNHFDFDLYSR